MCNAAQCQACKEFVLVIARRNNPATHFRLEAVYPLGKADDRVDPAVPSEIAKDFAEGLRCRWVQAHKATVVMCRRAIQASCLEKGAIGKRLVEQIDDLGAKGLVTNNLKEFAHEIRLIGNAGAHPEEDNLTGVTEKDSDDMIEFTRHYFEHVYVMPARLQARRSAAP